ncbi:MAG: methionine adenosyltransferase [Planctomycetes bacterium]|nr:methionine adenosyltransferase [Planctomycetota bacterium]
MSERHLFTSESVSMGHPDKVSDQISDAVLDAVLEQDPNGRVACEVLVTTGLVVLAGEITTTAVVDYQGVARRTIEEIGYTDAAMGFDAHSCAVVSTIHRQSPDISQGVTEGQGLHTEQGAGDQGLMFGFACDETPALMPLPIQCAHDLVRELARSRRAREIPYLRPDAKSQVTVEYEGTVPRRVHTVVVSTQHNPDVEYDTIRQDMIEKVIRRVIPSQMMNGTTIFHVNPTGRFVIGGPHGDTGLTGRKIIVDTYGGMGRHGGGAFSGKDPSKVDRSASYAARYVAKNLVAAGLARRCEVQLAYAIGVADPLSVRVDSFGTGSVADQRLVELVRSEFSLTPKGIIEMLDLKRPIYRRTARHGHFGRTRDLDTFTWERTDRVEALRKAAGV